MKTTISIVTTVSILFYLISKRSFGLSPETSELFMIYTVVSNTLAFMIPVTVYIFCMATSALMFNILEEDFKPLKMARIIAISFFPIILNCLIYLAILYGFSIGLSVTDMSYINIFAWGGFYVIFVVLTKTEFEIHFFKAFLIAVFPSIMLQVGKYFIA